MRGSTLRLPAERGGAPWCTLTRCLATGAVALWLGLPGSALAQPGNPGPAEYIDLGDLGIGQTLQSDDIPIGMGETVWFRFRLLTAISPLKNWLDLDTAGPATIANTEMAIYDARANKIGEDNDSGGGPNGWAAAMSFGGGSGEMLSVTGGRISDGNWGPTLNAGVYFVAVVGYNADFNQDPNTNWQVSTNSTEVGTVRLRVASGAVPATYWNERHRGQDSGDTPGNAQIVEGDGPLTAIVASFSGGKDMFGIRICDGASFQVVAQSTWYGGGTYRSNLYLFDSSGRGVLAIRNTRASTNTVLSLPAQHPPLPEGDYYLVVSSYCAGIPGNYFGPYDVTDQQLWEFGVGNVTIPPNGPGADNPVEYWGRQSNCENVGSYFVRLSLTGACHATRRVRGDLDCNDVLDAFDIEPFLLALVDPNGYAMSYPACDRNLADINADGAVDAFDIEPFIQLLVGPYHASTSGAQLLADPDRDDG